MPSVAEALKQYGFVGQLANSNPELRAILVRAANGNWSAEEFSRAVQDSSWWRNSADSVKQYQILRTTKPGEFEQQRREIENKVRTLAAEMGVSTFGGDFAHLVNLAQSLGWDEAVLRQRIGSYLGTKAIQSGKTFGGSAGEIQQQIRSLYYDMGARYSGYAINLHVRDVLTGKTTVEAVRAQLTERAISTFPGLAEQIRGGATVRQLADPYIQAKAQLLEVPPEMITLQDTTVRRGMSYRDADGKVGQMPLWQYEQQVKQDPKWDRTKNARDAYSEMAHQIGRDWRFTT